jgi:putative GTP pyrophosphokinase
LATISPLYSRNQVAKAGDLLRSDNLSAGDKIWASEVLSNWRAIHSYPINTFKATLRDKLKALDNKALVAQRLKRAPSIISKLRRFSGMKLPRMQDIGGLRAVVSNLKKAEELRENYKNSRFKHELVGEKDYIENPKDTGYRGIHLIYKYKNKAVNLYDGLHIELQIRTKLQHSWATAVETMGTFLEHALKSSEGPEEWLSFFALTGSAFAHYEGCNPVPGYEDLLQQDTYEKMIAEAERLNVIDRLQAFSIAANSISNDKKRGSYHIVILDPGKKTVSIESFGRRKLDEANKRYSHYENQISDGESIQVVLVATGSIESLRQAYPNYFLDTHEFIKVIQKINTEITNANKQMHPTSGGKS